MSNTLRNWLRSKWWSIRFHYYRCFSSTAQVGPPTRQGCEDHDYVSDGLTRVDGARHFPDRVVGNKSGCRWPYLRRGIPHHWYVDRRFPMAGFLSTDEVQLLYNLALPFRGKAALEIGCWFGWSACHLALAGVKLDIVNPILAKREVRRSVEQSLSAAGILDTVKLVEGSSPAAVEELARTHGRQWSFLFVDGDHEALAPLDDARVCERHAAGDAMVVFHDLTSPDVARGLAYFKEKGWNTLIYQTMQIMGIAWRGDVKPVRHRPDPAVAWQLPDHLREYAVSS
ncbi:MAG: class I SAM-dependent methyltransferase [Gemmataceae bacterium]|nr:class I SAM-dependent methyltransferase [Gemmataceae bacterium]